MNLTALAIEQLADGKWHSVSEIYNAIECHITPERAVNRFRVEKPSEELLTGQDVEAAVRVGKWRIVGYIMSSAKRDGMVESTGRNMLRQYRLFNGGKRSKPKK